MPAVRLSGTISGPDDSMRGVRAELFATLFESGYSLNNANGDHEITLGNIEATISDSDAFVFMPEPDLQDLFSASSVFVGYQTLDPELEGKPTALLSPARSWSPFLDLLDHLRKMGTIRQNPADYLHRAASPREVLDLLKSGWKAPGGDHHADGGPIPDADIPEVNEPRPDDYRFNVCVFCSASIKDEAMLQEGYDLGKGLAEAKLGCVSGAGRTGIMGKVVAGAAENGGWSGGSNVPHIIELEGLPDGLSAFWPRPDIYTRMEVMIEESDAFVIMPGGCGTVQELFALLVRKNNNDPTMKDKPIVVFDRDMGEGETFWSPLFQLIADSGEALPVEVAKTLDEIVPLVEKACLK